MRVAASNGSSAPSGHPLPAHPHEELVDLGNHSATAPDSTRSAVVVVQLVGFECLEHFRGLLLSLWRLAIPRPRAAVRVVQTTMGPSNRENRWKTTSEVHTAQP